MFTLAELPSAFFHGQDRLRGHLDPEVIAPTYLAEIAGVPPMDAEGHNRFGRSFYDAFPDLHHTIDEVVVAPPRVTVRFTLRGTQTGEFLGSPPSGRAIDVSAIALMTVDEGRVVHVHGAFDQLGLLRQIGALPS
jgi:predicted ester cyclase